MTPSDPGTVRGRVCPRDGFAWVLDVETARKAIEAGWPAVRLWRCRNGHSVREWPAERPRGWTGRLKPCAVCGRMLPKANAKYCPGACATFANRANWRWHQRYPFKPYILEAQPWYVGPLYHRAPLPPLDPLAGRMPRCWADGWLRVHGLGLGESAA